MQTDRAIGLNDVCDDVITGYILHLLAPNLFVPISGNTEEELYNTIDTQKTVTSSVANLMISKKFYQIIKPKYDAYKKSIKNIETSEKLYSMANLFACLSYPEQSINFILKRETWLKTTTTDLLSVTISHDPSFPFLVEIRLTGQEIPIKSDGPFSTMLFSKEMPDSVEKLLCILQKNGEIRGFSKSIMYFLLTKKEEVVITCSLQQSQEAELISVQDAISICQILQLFTTTPSQEPTILEKINNTFTDLTETFRKFKI
jgi:hypothetical protein